MLIGLIFFQKYFEHDSFEDIKKRAILIHIDVPGQEDGAEDFPDDFVFPRLQVYFKFLGHSKTPLL